MKIRLLVTLVFLLSLGCSTTTSIVSISDESYRDSHFLTVVVSAPYEDLQIRSEIESLFKRALADGYTRVFRAMDILPPLKPYSDSQFAKVMKEKEIQCVLVIGITDYWQTYYSTPDRVSTKTEFSSSSQYDSHSMWGGLFGIRTTGSSSGSGTSTTTTRYIPGITLSQSNVKLDARMFVFGSDYEAVPIWRANSTTSGNYFTPESKVFLDAAAQINRALRNDRILTRRFVSSNTRFIHNTKRLGTYGVVESEYENIKSKGIIILGGMNYSHVLGCLNCKEFDLQNVFNKHGVYGVSSEHTFWDPCSIYSSDTSQFSACNPNALFPPVIVNKYGKTIGRLTIIEGIPSNYKDSKLKKWLLEEICVECISKN